MEPEERTVPRVAPKLTKFFSGIGLKFCPVIITAAPMGAVAGAYELITGFTAAKKVTDSVTGDAKPLVAINL